MSKTFVKFPIRFFAVLSLFIITLALSYTASAQTTVVVNQTNLSGWLFYNDETDVIDNTLGSFVNGPGTPNMGVGGAKISATGTQRRNLATYQFSGTPLANITTLKFTTYNPSAGNGGSANRSGYLHFNVDFNGSDTFQRRLVFVPASNGAVVQNTWQEWDAINSGNAMWSYSGATWAMGVGGGGEPGTTLKTWSQILSQYPGVRIRVTDAFVGIRVGEPYANGYTENIDSFKFGTSSGTTYFNFDPPPSLTVTPAAAPTATDNDYTRINNAVQSIAAGGTITLSGTFNWTEANAAASWALGSDGQTGGAFSNDDYCILPPANVNGVTITAASPGAATIQGPGDLAVVNLEGVFQFFNDGDNQNWTISNLRFLDFDLAIGMFNGAGGSDAYNNTHIVNNYIRVPADLNATVAPSDASQNIGIHFSFGTNQLISGNTIDLNGGGTSAAPNFASEVGMQSNTSGGAIYNGLQITNNTINVTNAQNNANPETILGYWENAHAHTSNITVSGNQFLSLAAGNNPAVNLNRGFRVTSHSSGTSTVTYSNNRVEGANIGFQWISGSAFSGNQAVRLTSNVIRNNATGVLVQSNGVANLSFNRIVGNSATGVNNIDGIVTAENNWWGCNYGAGAGGAGCAGTPNGTTGTVDANPWLVLRTSAGSNPVVVGGTSLITSTLNFNSDNLNTSGSGSVPNGTPAAFSGTLGTVSPSGGSTASGVTTTTFTAGVTPGNGNAATVIDGQTVNAAVIIISVACNAVSAPGGMVGLVGSTLTVPISTDSLTTRGVSSYDFTFTYNSSALTFTGVSQAGTISSGMIVTPNSATPGTLTVGAYSDSYLSGSGTLLNLNFTVNGPIGSSSPLNFSGFMYNEGVPCVNTTNGSFSAASGTISGAVTYLNSVISRPVPGVVLTASGAVIQTDTTDAGGLYDLSNLGNSAYTVTPSKSGDVLGAISGLDASRIAQHVVGLVVPGATPFAPGGGAFQSADVSGNGTITSLDASLVARYVVNLSSGNTGTWRFVPVSRSYTTLQVQSGASNQNYTAILMGDVTGNWNGIENPTRPSYDENARPEDFIGVNAPKMSVGSGSSIIIPLELRNLNRKDVVAYQFEMGFNQKVIQPAANPCDVLGTVSKDLIVTCSAETPGVLKVVVFGINPVATDGILLNLRFTAIGSAGYVTPLSFKGLMLNEGEPMSRAQDGEIRISDNPNDSDSISGQLLSANGTGIAGAKVQLTASSGEIRVVYADGFGYYNFDKVTIGETYVISVISNRHTFNAQTISAAKGATQMNLIAEQ
ncbi:MAG: cohesin domain-containing protein [Pyrinomonadaceae bacterium]